MVINLSQTLVHATDDYDETCTFVAAYIPAERWNGAAKPFFSSIEASRIAEDTAVSYPYGQQFRWNGALEDGNGGFEYDLNADGEPAEWHAVATLEVDGVTYYQMGDGFTWQEIERPAVADADDEYAVEELEEYVRLETAVMRAMAEHADVQTTGLHYARVNTQGA